MLEILVIYYNFVDRFFWLFEVVLCLEVGKFIDGYFYKGLEKYGNFNELFRLIGVYDKFVFCYYLWIFNFFYEKIFLKIMILEELDIFLKVFMGLLEFFVCENCDFF